MGEGTNGIILWGRQCNQHCAAQTDSKGTAKMERQLDENLCEDQTLRSRDIGQKITNGDACGKSEDRPEGKCVAASA